jgi:hypothetical protein
VVLEHRDRRGRQIWQPTTHFGDRNAKGRAMRGEKRSDAKIDVDEKTATRQRVQW